MNKKIKNKKYIPLGRDHQSLQSQKRRRHQILKAQALIFFLEKKRARRLGFGRESVHNSRSLDLVEEFNLTNRLSFGESRYIFLLLLT